VRRTTAWLAVPLLLVLSGLTIGCRSGAPEPRIEQLDSPAPPGSRFPSLVVHEDQVYLSWISGEEPDASIDFAVSDDGEWSATATVASGPDLFVNWADFPSLAIDDAGNIAAQWLVRGGGPSWAYGVRFAVRLPDGGWTEPSIPHGEDHAGEHGFVSVVSAQPGRFELIWLDGRTMGDGGPMELRRTTWGAGRFDEQEILDDDVCTCCQTDMAAFADERFVVYRDHTPGEIRDISYVRSAPGGWSAPATLHHDGWQIAACPVNGPAVDAHEAKLAVAWFTQANDQPRVWALASDDFGNTFGEAIRIDVNDPIGRVDVAVLADGGFVTVWLERDEDDAVVNVRRVVGGVPGEIHALGRVAAHRGSGFPRVATDGEDTWVAWTETSRPPRVRLARVRW